MQSNENLTRRFDNTNFTKIAVYSMATIAILFIVALIVYIILFRCPGGSLTACIDANRQVCGNPVITDRDSCEKFVKETENCFCEKCSLCTAQEQRNECKLSEDIRIERCRSSFPNLESTSDSKRVPEEYSVGAFLKLAQ